MKGAAGMCVKCGAREGNDTLDVARRRVQRGMDSRSQAWLRGVDAPPRWQGWLPPWPEAGSRAGVGRPGPGRLSRLEGRLHSLPHLYLQALDGGGAPRPVLGLLLPSENQDLSHKGPGAELGHEGQQGLHRTVASTSRLSSLPARRPLPAPRPGMAPSPAHTLPGVSV